MSEILVLCAGKIKETFYTDLISESVKNINKKHHFCITEVPDEGIPKNAGESVTENIRKKEADKLLSFILPTDFVVALCIEGKLMNDEDLKKLEQKASDMGKQRIVFVIGGSLGLHDSVTGRANCKMSFSRMTFPHQLMRVILVRQIEADL